MTNGHDFDAADERRRAALAALELETRALNAERALEHARDEIASLRTVALGPPDASWQDDRIVDLETQLEAERDRRITAERQWDEVHASLEAEMTRHVLLTALLRAKDERLAQHAGCVPLVELRELLDACERRYARGGLQATSEVLDELAHFLVERTAAAARGETGGGA
jgi:hypothetical protein